MKKKILKKRKQTLIEKETKFKLKIPKYEEKKKDFRSEKVQNEQYACFC